MPKYTLSTVVQPFSSCINHHSFSMYSWLKGALFQPANLAIGAF